MKPADNFLCTPDLHARATAPRWRVLLLPLGLALVHCGYPEITYDGLGGTGGADGGADPCDLDDDGQRATGGTCNGTDCDDNDADVFAGQTAFFATPRADGSFDYDCDGAETRQTGTITCSGTSPCAADEGYASDVACGDSAAVGTCTAPLLTCEFTAGEARTQACR